MNTSVNKNFSARLDDTLMAHDKPAIELKAITHDSGTQKQMADLLPDNPTVKEFDEVRGFVSSLTTDKRPLPDKLHEEWSKTLNAHQLIFKAQKALHQINAGQNGAQPTTAKPLSVDDAHMLDTLFSDLKALAQSQGGSETAQTIADNCQTVKDKIQTLIQALTQRPATSVAENDEAEHHHHHHDHGGGAIMIDLDEAIHGLYAAVSYLSQSLKGGGAELGKEFQDEAQMLQNAPMDWLQHTVAPHGASDFAVSMGVAGLLTPFSLMAVKAGVEEVLGATHTHQELNKQIDDLQQRAGYLNPLASKQAPDSLVSVKALSNNQQIADMKFSKKQNRDGGAVGGFSFSSGATITGKMGMESAAKIINFAGGSVGPAVGVASTFALGPAAAISATGLGGYMVHKSQKKAAAFTKEAGETHKHIDALMDKIKADPQLENYSHFLDKKMAQHKDFFDNYRDWNRGFLAGTGIYTAGAMAKVGVATAALAGGFADPTGATPIALLALTSAGGAIMGASSHQFFSGHGRHHRYEKYHRDDDMELDRHFLSAVDLLAPGEGGDSALKGFSLRANFHQHISQREDVRQDFLKNVATQAGKTFSGSYTWTADSAEVVAKRGEKPGKKQAFLSNLDKTLQNSKVRMSAAKAFVGSVAQGNIKRSSQKAKDVWNSERPELSKTQLQRLLEAGSPEIASSVHQMMHATLSGQIALSTAKRDAKLSAYGTLSRHISDPALTQQQASQEAQQIQKLMVQLEHDLHQDHLWHSQLLDVDSALRKNGASEAEQSQTIDRFIALQSGKPFNPDEQAKGLTDSYHDLAHYLLKDAPTRYRDLRGKLLETELESTRLKVASHNLTQANANTAEA